MDFKVNEIKKKCTSFVDIYFIPVRFDIIISVVGILERISSILDIFSNEVDENIILREIEASRVERAEKSQSYEDGVKAILLREDGHNIANFVSRSRLLDKILRTYTSPCMYDARWAGDHLIVTLCILLRRQFTNPYAERRNSRLTVTLIRNRSLVGRRKKE